MFSLVVVCCGRGYGGVPAVVVSSGYCGCDLFDYEYVVPEDVEVASSNLYEWVAADPDQYLLCAGAASGHYAVFDGIIYSGRCGWCQIDGEEEG